MSNMLILLLSISSLLLSVESDQGAAVTAEEEIKALLFAQQEDWNNGDIDAFMTLFWKSEKLRYYGASGITSGWQNILDNYKTRYPSRDAMGKLTFEILELDEITSDSYILMGTFSLERKDDNPTGRFTIVWKKIDGSWKVIADMTCAD